MRYDLASYFYEPINSLLERSTGIGGARKRLISMATGRVLELGVGTQLAFLAVDFHIVNHAIAKTLLFFTVGAFIYHSKAVKVDKLAGVGREMPLTTPLFALATLSLAGVPLLNVFFSKMLIFNALLQASPLIISVVIITSAIAAWTYFQLFVTLWRGKPVEGHNHEHEAVGRHEIPIFVAVNFLLGILVVVFGLLAPAIIDKFFHLASVQAIDYNAYTPSSFRGWGLILSGRSL